MSESHWQVVLTLTDPSEAIIRVYEKYLRDEWLGPGNPDREGPFGATVEVRQVSPDAAPTV